MSPRMLLLRARLATALHSRPLTHHQIEPATRMMPQCVARLSAPFTPPRPPAVTQRRTISCRSYSAPETYDIAFSFRDFESEVAFLLDAHQTHTNAPLKRFLEVGCGPARHSLLLAQAAGAQCTGLDLSFEMLEYAAQRAQQAGVESKVAFVRGNMADPGGIAQLIPGGEVDMAAVLLGTLSHCLDNQAALQCFRNLAQVVRPGGLLVLELSHPSELFDGSFMSLNDFADCWEVNEEGAVEFAEKREAPEGADDASAAPPPDEEDLEEESDDEEEEESGGGLKRVLVEYGREGDTFDFSTQVLERTVGLSLFDGEGTLVSSTVDVVPQRQFSLQEIELLGRVTGWQVAAVHGDLQANVPLDGEEAYRMVVVLKKTAQS